ncbi:hypothetical protein Tco_0674878 [Tanacetum coccineum]
MRGEPGSVATVLEAQAAIMASTNNPNSKPRKTSVARKCAYEKFTSYQLFYFNGTDISQKDEKPSKKRQNRTQDGKVCEVEAQSKSSQLREEKAKKNIT